MYRISQRLCLAALVIAFAHTAQAADTPSPLQVNGDSAMGDWQGTWDKRSIYAQVNPQGNGTYTVNILSEFDKRGRPLLVLKGQGNGTRVELQGKRAKTQWNGTIEGDRFRGKTTGKVNASFSLKKVIRLSPRLGAKPPEGAIVLLDGTNLDAWVQTGANGGKPSEWKLLDTGAMEVTRGGVVSRHNFKDHKLHVEFRTPFIPEARGQERGNSGVYLQGRYEVQVLDSYSLLGEWNECGGIYHVSIPRVNMAAPPLQWQSYDITFHAPRFDAKGMKTKDALITVIHNGVMIHENLSIPEPTAANIGGDIREAQGVHLQDHGSPVQYRNIWAVELND